jgi:hypothetical protein
MREALGRKTPADEHFRELSQIFDGKPVVTSPLTHHARQE